MIFFDIAGKRYNKAQAIRTVSNVVAKYNIGEELSEEDAKIAQSLYELRFGYPPERDFKFFIDSDGYGYKCFHHIDKNGNVDHFSFRKALSKKPAISKRNILTAFRVAVDEQVALQGPGEGGDPAVVGLPRDESLGHVLLRLAEGGRQLIAREIEHVSAA
jgi:hypothetical protein